MTQLRFLRGWQRFVPRLSRDRSRVIERRGVRDEPDIDVDSLEIAQFVHLILRNEKIRHFVDVLTSKAVLLLGRFSTDRKPVLEALKTELRAHGYVPILFDFAKPESRDFTETVTLLARLARFVVVDLSAPMSVPKELESIVPHVAVPIVSLVQGSHRAFSMFQDYEKYAWVLRPRQYDTIDELLGSITEYVIRPAELKLVELRATKW